MRQGPCLFLSRQVPDGEGRRATRPPTGTGLKEGTPPQSGRPSTVPCSACDHTEITSANRHRVILGAAPWTRGLWARRKETKHGGGCCFHGLDHRRPSPCRVTRKKGHQKPGDVQEPQKPLTGIPQLPGAGDKQARRKQARMSTQMKQGSASGLSGVQGAGRER